MPDHEYQLIAVKRDWCPEWLFSLCRWIVPIYPFRWIFTRALSRKENKDAE